MLRRRFDAWSVAREGYLALVWKQREFTAEEADRIETQFLQIEVTIAMSAAKRWFHGKVPRLSFQISPPGHSGHSRLMLTPNIEFREIEFGDFAGEFFLETGIDAAGLPYVSDDFWDNVVGLAKFKGFGFVENSYLNNPPKQIRAMQRSGRSNIYKLIRNYTTHRFLDHEVEDLGSFEVRWQIETDWDTFVDEFQAVFGRLVKINQALYRARYQRRKQMVQKAERLRNALRS